MCLRWSNFLLNQSPTWILISLPNQAKLAMLAFIQPPSPRLPHPASLLQPLSSRLPPPAFILQPFSCSLSPPVSFLQTLSSSLPHPGSLPACHIHPLFSSPCLPVHLLQPLSAIQAMTRLERQLFNSSQSLQNN